MQILPSLRITRGEPFAYDVTVTNQSWVGYSGSMVFRPQPIVRRSNYRSDKDYFTEPPLLIVDAVGDSSGLIQVSLTAEQTALLPSVPKIGFFPTAVFEIYMTRATPADTKRFQGYVNTAESIGATGTAGTGASVLPGPQLVTAPSVIGTGEVGTEHNVTTGTWIGAVAFNYRWLRNTTAISGQEASAYTTTDADDLTTLTAQVQSIDSDGEASDWVSGNAISVTYANPAIVIEPVVDGSLQPGGVLTAINYTFTGDAPFAYDFVWLSGGLVISGETNETYTATDADATQQVRVGVRATDGAGRTSGYIYSETVTINYSGLSFSAQPTFDDTAYVQGEVVTINIGAAGPAATITVNEFALDGADKRSELVAATATTYTWDSTGEAAGAITYQTTAANSSESVASNRLTVSLDEAVPTVPDALDDAFWSVTNEGTGGKLIFTVISAPVNGGSAIIRYEYRQNAGSAVSLGIFEPGSVTVSGFTNGVAADYELRAVNSDGNGAWNLTPKSATASDITAPETLTAIFDTPTNALTVDHNEPAKTWYLVNTSATPLTGAAIKAAVIATTPIAYGSIDIGTAEVTPTFTGLSTGTYYLHLACEDASVNVEAIGTVVEFDWTGTADTTDPVLSLPTDAANGTNAATGTVTTANDANGTLYWVVSTSASAPNAAQMVAGQMHTSAPGADFGAQSVTATGLQNITASGLSAGTPYFTHYMHRDAAGNDSNIATADGFTTTTSTGDVEFVSSTLMLSTSATGDGPNYVSTSDHTVSSQSNRVVYLEIRGCLDTVGAVPTISACTFGGVAGTAVVAPVGSGSRDWAAIYRFVAPAAGARGCTLNLSATQRGLSIRAVEYKNNDQLSPVVASGSDINGGGFGTTISFTQTTLAGSMLNSALCIESGNLAAEIAIAGGATLVAAEQTGTTASSDLSAGSAYEATPSAGSNGHAYNWTTSKRATLVWAELRAA